MTTSSAAPPQRGTSTFGVRTRIARATGKDGRFTCGAVRALPGAERDRVILQATDGHQATCVLCPGEMAAPRLVPTGVLPTRQLAEPAAVRLVDDHWQSTEGKLAHDPYGPDAQSFPPIGEVLPELGPRPYHETARHAERRRIAGDRAQWMHVVLGLNVAELHKVADGLGTPELTLLIPVPVNNRRGRHGELHVNKPVAICPAKPSGGDSGDGGVGVIMPLAPEQGTAYYAKVRQAVVAAEASARGPKK